MAKTPVRNTARSGRCSSSRHLICTCGITKENESTAWKGRRAKAAYLVLKVG